jgi:Mn-containing catalase
MPVILRVDRLQIELPAPSDPDPAAAAAVQELLGGRFGEMSTLMNYTYQSFNLSFRTSQGRYLPPPGERVSEPVRCRWTG